MTKAQLLDLFSKAIATEEGFYASNHTVAQRNNNPGNLRWWQGVSIRDGFACFETPEDGWVALRRQCELNIFKRGLTFLEFFQGKPKVYGGYAPAADHNNPELYARFVVWYIIQHAVPGSMPMDGQHVKALTITSTVRDLVTT